MLVVVTSASIGVHAKEISFSYNDTNEQVKTATLVELVGKGGTRIIFNEVESESTPLAIDSDEMSKIGDNFGMMFSTRVGDALKCYFAVPVRMKKYEIINGTNSVEIWSLSFFPTYTYIVNILVDEAKYYYLLKEIPIDRNPDGIKECRLDIFLETSNSELTTLKNEIEKLNELTNKDANVKYLLAIETEGSGAQQKQVLKRVMTPKDCDSETEESTNNGPCDLECAKSQLNEKESCKTNCIRRIEEEANKKILDDKTKCQNECAIQPNQVLVITCTTSCLARIAEEANKKIFEEAIKCRNQCAIQPNQVEIASCTASCFAKIAGETVTNINNQVCQLKNCTEAKQNTFMTAMIVFIVLIILEAIGVVILIIRSDN